MAAGRLPASICALWGLGATPSCCLKGRKPSGSPAVAVAPVEGHDTSQGPDSAGMPTGLSRPAPYLRLVMPFRGPRRGPVGRETIRRQRGRGHPRGPSGKVKPRRWSEAHESWRPSVLMPLAIAVIGWAVSVRGDEIPPQPVDGSISWVYRYADGKRLGRETGKPLFVVFRC